MEMIKRKVIFVFVLLLVMHVLHVFEELFGNAYFIDSFYNGLTGFLIINIILWIIPLILLFYVMKKKKMAYYLSIIYGLIMVIDGLDHIIRNYAGFYTGILLVIIGFLLILYLYKGVKNMKGGNK